MKASLAVLMTLFAASAYADPACTALSNYVGTYKLVGTTCKGPFGDKLVVKPYTASDFSGYVITTGGIGIGPSTSANATDKCTVTGNTVTVQTCAFDRSCLPQYWTYTFSGSNVSFLANGCEVQFAKTTN